MKNFKLLLLLITTVFMLPVELAESGIVASTYNNKEFQYNKIFKKEQPKEWRVTATTYNPVVGQTNSDPTLTADMSRINLKKLKKGQIKWIAVSRDFLKRGDLKYGDKVEIVCEQRPDLNGVYEIHDTMNKRFKNKIDILQDISEKGGLFRNVKLTKIEIEEKT